MLLCATHICIARTCCRKMAVCPSHAGIVSKRLKISSIFVLGLVAIHYGSFLIPHHGCEILTGTGDCHSGGLRNFPSDNAVRPYGLPIRLLPPQRYGSTVANQLPILFLPPNDIASLRFLSTSWASCISLRLNAFCLLVVLVKLSVLACSW